MAQSMSRWDCVARRFRGRDAVVGVEVGIAEGKMSAKLLSLMPTLKLYMVDRWCEYSKEERKRDPDSQQPKLRQVAWDKKYAIACNAVKRYGERAQILRVSSAEAAGQFDRYTFDFVFLDADHSYEGLTEDIKLWLPLVKRGGWLCGHDYHNEHFPKPGVDRAVDEAFGPAVVADGGSTWFYRVV